MTVRNELFSPDTPPMEDATPRDDGIVLASPHQHFKSVPRPDASGDIETTWKPCDSEDPAEEVTALAMDAVRYGDSLTIEEGKTLACKPLNAAARAKLRGSVPNRKTLMQTCSEATAAASYRNQPIALTAFSRDQLVKRLPGMPNKRGDLGCHVGSAWGHFSAARTADSWRPGTVRPI